MLLPIAQQVPLVIGELGENDCASTYVEQLMTWADGVGVHYLAWTWNAWSCGGGPALITDYAGTPTAFGAGVRVVGFCFVRLLILCLQVKAHFLNATPYTGTLTTGPTTAAGSVSDVWVYKGFGARLLSRLS